MEERRTPIMLEGLIMNYLNAFVGASKRIERTIIYGLKFLFEKIFRR